MALFLSGTMGALGMTDASMNQTGIKIKCFTKKEKKKLTRDRKQGQENSVSLTISSCESRHSGVKL